MPFTTVFLTGQADDMSHSMPLISSQAWTQGHLGHQRGRAALVSVDPGVVQHLHDGGPVGRVLLQGLQGACVCGPWAAGAALVDGGAAGRVPISKPGTREAAGLRSRSRVQPRA